MNDKVRTFTEEEIKETAREIAIRYKQLQKENERLRDILKSFCIPADICDKCLELLKMQARYEK